MRRGTARHERSNLSKKAAVCCLRPRRPRGSISGSPAHRWAEGRIERFTELAAEVARLKVDLIVAATTPAVIAAKHGELHVVAPEFDARDSQALVVVNGFIPIIPALVNPSCLPPPATSGARDRVQGEIPESNALAVLGRRGRSHECECDRNKQDTAHSRLPQGDALTSLPPARRTSLAQETVDILRLVEILGRFKRNLVPCAARVKKAGGATACSCVQKPPRNRLTQVR